MLIQGPGNGRAAETSRFSTRAVYSKHCLAWLHGEWDCMTTQSSFVWHRALCWACARGCTIPNRSEDGLKAGDEKLIVLPGKSEVVWQSINLCSPTQRNGSGSWILEVLLSSSRSHHCPQPSLVPLEFPLHCILCCFFVCNNLYFMHDPILSLQVWLICPN